MNNLNPVPRIGILGGSFDPVHCGHLLMAEAACEEASLDRLVFVPAAQAPLKSAEATASPAERLRLLRLALAGCPEFEIDTQEIERGGVSYTIDTLRKYRSRHPEALLYYLIGADHLPILPRWKCADELAKEVDFLVIPRPGEPETALPSPFRGRFLNGMPFGVSSTEIRARVRKGLPIRHLVPPAVEEAILETGFYRP